ncbi:hypothetical protein PR048_012383 [Dryococelus australis]|uniref:Uncharacterized protein n=1 Tax=Dryococelus australis TaxID=614101 RepID=A0ABQ9HP92_9NEOP|nr:hypothetical protein PR048_012383 [Dryococelus australis]
MSTVYTATQLAITAVHIPGCMKPCFATRPSIGAFHTTSPCGRKTVWRHTHSGKNSNTAKCVLCSSASDSCRFCRYMLQIPFRQEKRSMEANVIPHHAVLKRPVQLLNPELQRDFVHMIFNFRTMPVVFTAKFRFIQMTTSISAYFGTTL